SWNSSVVTPVFAITNARVVLPDRIELGWTVLCRDGRILNAGPAAGVPLPGDALVEDARGALLAPGFVDLHIHGCGEHLVDDGPAALEALSSLLPRYGVTTFLPAVLPRPTGEDALFVAELASARPRGAQVAGLLLEGPFLSITGALPQEALGAPDLRRVRQLKEAAASLPAVFAVSPEFPGLRDLLPEMTGGGIPAFITHTRAGVEDTQTAIELGARHATHFYDVFYAPPETDPGVRPAGAVEAILADERVSVDFIVDGEHVHPVVVKMALRCKGPGRVCLITDANRGAGLPPGRYDFGGRTVEFAHPGAPARFTDEHPELAGGLAGSGLTMDGAVRNAVRLLGVDTAQAIRMASTNPAAVLGLQTETGRIEPGLSADLVLLDDDLTPLKTWVAGKCVYDKAQGLDII
ncbi:MAG: amidohydrolase family protein, partial [Armatimonadota bacterium]